MKPTLKLWHTDYYKGWDRNDCPITQLLSQRYSLEFDENPDLLIFLPFGFEHLRYRCRKLFVTGENVAPDFNICDHAFSFHYLDDVRNYRFPLGLWGEIRPAVHQNPEQELSRKTKFCNFVYSNPSCQTRNGVFEQLSKYKQVDSGGRCMNNLGFRVEDKRAFQSQYKFSFAFENCASIGYTSEKLRDAFAARTLPLYWGNPLVGNDFNANAFLDYSNYPNVNAMVEHIIELDNNDNLYLEFTKQPCYPDGVFPSAATPEKLLDQLETIVHSTETPVSQEPGRWLHQMRYITRHKNDIWSRRLQRWKYRLQHRLKAA